MVQGKRKRSIAEQVAHQLSDLIEARAYLPGERLREQEIGERFQVSRGPVREALRILEAKSLVHIEARRGATVSHLWQQGQHLPAHRAHPILCLRDQSRVHWVGR
jgi:DNA-binding GntR family transcriptional regulator